MAGPRLMATVILLVLFWGTHQADAQALDVTIAVIRNDPLDFTTENDTDYRASSGPHTFTCTATGGTGSGSIQYQWTSASSTFQSSNNEIIRQSVNTIDEGTHTCMATRGGETGSASITVNIVGAGIFVFVGAGEIGTQPNNGLVISTNSGSGFRFRFFCRSDTPTVGVGELFGLDGNPIIDSNFFVFQETTIGGEFRIENVIGSEDILTASEQGVYTCRIPLESGVVREINIGVYSDGFSGQPTITNPLVFTPRSSSSTLTCTSSTSIATTVTFIRDSTTVGPLRDGDSMVFGGVTYELAQTVTDRGSSTFDNVVTINQPLTDIVGSSFSCSVANSIGPSIPSDNLQIMGGVRIINPGLLTVGEMATIQCTTDFTNIRIEWVFNGMVMESDTTGAIELNLVLDSVNQSYNGRVYSCIVTVVGGDTNSDMFTVITQVPMVSVATSPSGSGVAGEQYSITCNVVGADNLAATFSIEWRDPDSNMLLSGSSSSLNYTFTPLAESDAGTYTCVANVSSTLLTNPLTPSDTLPITVFSISMGSADNTDYKAAIIGGAVAGLLVMAVTAIVIIMLVLRHRDHRSRLLIQQNDQSVERRELTKSGDVDIRTTECVAYSSVTGNQSHGTDISTVPCIAYDQTQQIPIIQDVTYETIPRETEQAPAHINAETNGSEYETIDS